MPASSLSGVAARLIARYGAPMLLSKTGTPGYDPATGTVTGTPAEIEIPGIVESIEAAFVGGLVQAGDLLVTLCGEDLAEARPAPGDRLRIDGRWHDVVSVTAAAAGTAPLLFRLLVRR
ncbi:hypothetical protein NUH88_08890 [Nisaea acidiphila]|uniref:Uncharacterized protein n=1 Tax=Nisaea acidiphila TaxID=1862145 RepID=A0A9J7AVL1_9PROT|nr:hypothetical protein [Nisaea acidiphila]UUX51803.1 hypothetical protein NUH88_08890 [Nisaea acidiphila]